MTKKPLPTLLLLYSHLQLRETSELRMGNLCVDEQNGTFETTGLMGAVQ
jgi:hypothetical protein